MRSSRSLLHRLEHPQSQKERALPGDMSSLVASIGHHLQVMLNSRRGNAQTVPDYGTSDLTDMARGNQTHERVREEIRLSIEKYEPRLRDVRVCFVPVEDQPFLAHFDIEATVVGDGQQRDTVFRSVVETNGEVRVGPR